MNRILSYALILSLMIPAPFLFADNTTEAADIQIAQNRDASIQDRVAAIERLKETQSPELAPLLIDLFKSPEKERPPFIANLIKHLISAQDDQIVPELNSILKDKTYDVEKRKLALYILWQKSPKTITPELTPMIKDKQEETSFRASAIQDYGQLNDFENFKFAVPILTDKSEPAAVRIAVLYALENMDYFQLHANALTQIIQDPAEDPLVRKSTMLVASKTFPADRWQETLLTMIGNRNNKLEIRRLAVDHLKLTPLNPVLLPQLQKILDNESRPEMVNGLNELIRKIRNQ